MTDLQKITDYWQEGNLDEALKLVENISDDVRIEGKIVKSNILRSKGKYKIALELSEEALQESRNIQNKLLEIEALLSKAYLQMRPDTIEVTISNINDIEELIEQQKELGEEKLKEISSTLLIIKGGKSSVVGDFSSALDYYTPALKIKEALRRKLDIAITINKIGIVYFYMGDLKLSLQYFHKYLELSNNLHDKYWIAGANNLLSDTYEMKGELELALEYCKKGLFLRKEIGIALQIAFSYTTLGRIYQSQGEIDSAFENYEKAWQIRKSQDELADPFFQAEILFRLINLSYISQNLKSSEVYFNELTQIKEKTDNKIIDQVYRLCKAIVLKYNKRFVEKAQAQEIFRQIVNEDVLFNEFTTTSYLQLFDLLIDELKISGETAVIDEINQLMNKFTKFAEDQNSHTLLVELYVIQSKLALIDLNIEKSQNLLINAQEIAEEKGLRLLSIKISNEHDTLLHKLNKWNARLKEGISISDGIQLTEIEQSLNDLILKGGDRDSEPPSEIPLSLLILDNNGPLVFSKKFKEEINYNDELVASFISTILSFSKETFQTKSTIQRIIHQDYTILIHTHMNLVFSYVFSGYSYSAIQKLDLFIDTLKSQPDLLYALSKNYYKVSLSNKERITIIVDELFVTNIHEMPTNEVIIEMSKDDDEFTDNFPVELVSHKFLLHPVRLGIIKILNRHFRYPAAELRKIIGVAWGTFNKHVYALIKNEYILSQNEFIKDQSRMVLYLEPLGRKRYTELCEIVQSFIK